MKKLASRIDIDIQDKKVWITTKLETKFIPYHFMTITTFVTLQHSYGDIARLLRGNLMRKATVIERFSMTVALFLFNSLIGKSKVHFSAQDKYQNDLQRVFHVQEYNYQLANLE